MAELRPTIDKDGQRFQDEPIVVMPKPDRIGQLVKTALASCKVVGTRPPASVMELPRPITEAEQLKFPQPIVTGHERVRLRWHTFKDGKLVPKDTETRGAA